MTWLRRARKAFRRHASVAVAAAAVVLASGMTLARAASPSADVITVTPANPVLYTFTQFTVSGTISRDEDLDGFLDVAFNGVLLADVEVQESGNTFVFSKTVPLQNGEQSHPVVPKCGANKVTVSSEEDDEYDVTTGTDDVTLTADTEAGPTVGSATINVGCASISVSPDLVGNQQLPATFQVTPQNFPSPDGFTLTVDGTPQAFSTTGGGLDFTSSPSCGTHQVVLSQDFDEQLISARAQITVLCPQITLTRSAIALASQPTTVQVTGSQFHASQPVTISLDGTDVGSTMTNQLGNFSLPITATGLDCAAHQVIAREQATTGGPAFLLSASASLQVTKCKRTLAIDPAVLEPGELTHVTGTGFTPGKLVILTWQLPDGGAPLLGTLSVTAGGAGSIGAFFLVLPSELLGARQLVATQGATKLTANALVDALPTQPSSGDRMIYRG